MEFFVIWIIMDFFNECPTLMMGREEVSEMF